MSNLAQPSSRSGERPRVLVIDDSEIARTYMCSLLQGGGFDVSSLPSAIGATRTILHTGAIAAIVDVSMPGLSGDKLVGVLRSNPRLTRLIIVVVSERPPEELNRIRIETTADAVLSKTTLERQLIPLLKRLLQGPANSHPLATFHQSDGDSAPPSSSSQEESR